MGGKIAFILGRLAPLFDRSTDHLTSRAAFLQLRRNIALSGLLWENSLQAAQGVRVFTGLLPVLGMRLRGISGEERGGRRRDRVDQSTVERKPAARVPLRPG
jgi:hypothetical protein